MERVYLDNGSTSFPKAPGVGGIMKDYLEDEGVNISRGGYAAAYNVAERVLETREQLCRLLGFSEPQNVIFTSGVTASLNYLLKGFLQSGDHVLTSSIEHNAVMRPLNQLAGKGVAFDRIPCSPLGELDLDAFQRMIRPNTRLVVMTHASNVCGTLTPVAEVGAICREHGIRFVVDAAQTAGVTELHMLDMHIDALAFTGHKGLLGPQGSGGFIITDEMAAETEALLSGGTGSRSHLEEVPDFLPDKFEPGTPNLPGILGLSAALSYIEKLGPLAIGEKELTLSLRFMEGVREAKDVCLVGKPGRKGRISVVSLDFVGRDNAEIAYRLENEYGVMTRCGLHCAPAAHKTLGTFPGGTVRFVPSHATKEAEIDWAVQAVLELAAK